MAFDAETYAAAVGQIKKSLEGAGSIQGKDGTTFTPSINDDGYLVWTNNGGLTNPEPIKIIYKDVVDDLTSTDATKPLSANQGRVLAERVTELESIIGELNTALETLIG